MSRTAQNKCGSLVHPRNDVAILALHPFAKEPRLSLNASQHIAPGRRTVGESPVGRLEELSGGPIVFGQFTLPAQSDARVGQRILLGPEGRGVSGRVGPRRRAVERDDPLEFERQCDLWSGLCGCFARDAYTLHAIAARATTHIHRETGTRGHRVNETERRALRKVRA